MTEPSRCEFEALFVNNPSLDAIRAHLARFNPIKTMGMERMEIRHSAILGWLLNPQQTHGLGDSFLRAFLAEALRGFGGPDGPSALDVSEADLTDVEVRREWRRIDVLVLSPRNGWVFIIENKFDSSQHSDQLNRYMEVARDVFLDAESYRHVRGIFLTLGDEDPEDERYAPILYERVCDLLSRQIVGGLHPLAPEVATFLRHYIDVLQEATGMSTERDDLEKLARQLYRDHKRVLDFVIEHGKSTDFTIACDALFGEGCEYPAIVEIEGQRLVYGTAGSEVVSFLPEAWFDAFGGDEHWWHGCKNWWATFPVIVYLRLDSKADGTSGQVKIIAEVGPLSDHDFRQDLIRAISSVAEETKNPRIGFTKGAADEGRKYSRFFKRGVFPVEDIHDPDMIAIAMKKAIKSYGKEMDAVATVLPQFIKHAQGEASQ